MNYLHQLLLYETVTPLHVGCGQNVGVVDLPVIRERTTGYPFIPGSGIRGALRDRFEAADGELAPLLFGPRVEREESSLYAGSLSVHDAKVLLFPVRTDRGVFVWLTCPEVLRRLGREVEVFVKGRKRWGVEGLPAPGEEELIGPEALGPAAHLEELRYERQGGDGDAAAARLHTWAAALEAALGLPGLASRTALVADASFHYFTQHATTVTQHNRLDSAKTVEEGGLFSVEAVPPGTVLYGFLGAIRLRASAVPAEDEADEEPGSGEEEGNPQKAKESAEGLPQEPEDVLARFWMKLLPAEGAEGAALTLHLGGHEGTGLGVTRIVRASEQGGEP